MPDSSPTADVLPPARSLTEDLSRRDDEALAALISARPDLGRPAPADLTSLGVRALSPMSLRWAIDGLDTPHLRALEAAVVAGGGQGGRRTPAQIDVAAGLLGVELSTASSLLTHLVRLALAWEVEGGYAVPEQVAGVLGPIAGLAPTHPDDDSAPSDVGLLLADAPDGARQILAHLTWGPAAGVLDPDGPLGPASRWLLAQGLLRDDAVTAHVVLPRPVALALRGGRLYRNALDAPPITGRHPARGSTPMDVDGQAGARAADVIALVEEIADDWGHAPPRVLRAGGLAVRDLAGLATRLDLTLPTVGLVLEVALFARLIADDRAAEPAWAPTHQLDTWAEQDDTMRWADLVLAWRDMPRAPHRIGTRHGGVGINALAAGVDWAGLPELRREILGVLAMPEPGTPLTAEGIHARLSWEHPRRPDDVLSEAIPAVLAEAELLGITAAGALSAAGRLLLEDDTDAAALGAAVQLPEPVTHLIVQADLTAIAPGRLSPHLATFMRRAAQIESRGGAQTYRFTPESIGALLDDGWEADDVLRTLSAASSTPIPQPLEYLVRDVARRHGRARVGAAGSYVRSDDVAALDALMARPEVAAAGLRRIAPTVLVSSQGPTSVMAIARRAGVPLLVEGTDGAVVSAAAVPHRASTPRPPRVHVSPPPDAPAVVAALRRATGRLGDAASSATDPAVILADLRTAIADGATVWITVATADGSTSRRRLHPTRIDAGVVHGFAAGPRSSGTPAVSSAPATPAEDAGATGADQRERVERWPISRISQVEHDT